MATKKKLLQAAAGAGGETEQYVALLAGGSGFTNETHTTAVFPWTKSGGFGNQLNSSTFIYPNRSVGTAPQISFSPDKGALVAVHSDAPHATAVDWDAGYGSKYTNPSTAIGGSYGEGLAFHPNGDYLAVGSSGAPYLQVYDWSDASGWGARKSNSWNPNSTVNNLAWHPDGGWLVAVTQASQRWNAVKWTGSSLTTRYEPPNDPWPRGIAYRTSFNNAGTYVAVGAFNSTSNSPYRLNVRQFNAASAGNPFGTGVTINLPDSVGTTVYDVKWTPDDNALVILTNVSPYIHAYAWSNSTGLGSKFSNPSVSASNRPTDIAFNTDGDVVFISTNDSVMLEAYEFSSSTGFGSKYSSPTLSGYTSLSEGSGVAYLDMG
jgi:hypothetical protein